MRLSPLLSAAAATTLLVTLAGPAGAATEPAPGLGTALSSGSLVKLSAAGKVLEALRLELPTGTVDGSQALVRIVPLLSDGVPVGDPVEVGAGQEETFASRSEGVPGVLSLTSPGGTVSALLGPNGPVATASTTGLGGLQLLGADVLGDGTFSTTSTVTGTGSTATKSLALDGLALPTLTDLLDALGLDLDALPVGTLLDLLGGLDLLSELQITELEAVIDLLGLTTVEDLTGALSGAGLDALAAGLAPAEITSLLALAGDPAATTAVTDLQGQIATLTAAQTALLGDLPLDADLLAALTPLLTDALLVNPLLLTDPAALLAVVQGLLTSTQADLVETLTGVLGDVLAELPVPADLLGLLDTSLLSMGAFDVTTLARSGDADSADVTGSLAGLDVLGTDVLDAVLGTSEVDLTTLLAGTGLGDVQAQVDGLLGTVTGVLATAGVTLPLPEIEILGMVEEILTDADGTKTARAGVEALSLTWALDELEIPALLSQTGLDILGGLPVPAPLSGDLAAAVLPTDQLAGLLSEPLSLVVGDLTDASLFTAAGAVPPTVVPGTTSPTLVPDTQLPRTGPTEALAALGVLLLAAAATVRRRSGRLQAVGA